MSAGTDVRLDVETPSRGFVKL